MLPLLTSALEAFVKLLERSSNLQKIRVQDKQIIFNDFVNPLFEALEPVAVNYMEVFRKARQMVNENALQDLPKAAQSVRQSQRAMLVTRIKVRELAKQMAEQIGDEEVVKFANDVNNFFYESTDTSLMRTARTLTDRLAYYIEQAANDRNDSKMLEHISDYVEFMDRVINALEQSWSSIVQSYEKLKIQLLLPPRYIRKT